MGTRHYINIYKGKTKIISNYGQWDGYLTGQGTDIQEFLKNESNVRDLIDTTKKFRKPESTKDYNEGVSWCEYIYDIYPSQKLIRVTDLYAKKTLEFTFDEYIKLDLSKVSFKSKKLEEV